MPMVTWKPMSAKLHVHAPLLVTRMSRPIPSSLECPFTWPLTNQYARRQLTNYSPQPATTAVTSPVQGHYISETSAPALDHPTIE